MPASMTGCSIWSVSVRRVRIWFSWRRWTPHPTPGRALRRQRPLCGSRHPRAPHASGGWTWSAPGGRHPWSSAGPRVRRLARLNLRDACFREMSRP